MIAGRRDIAGQREREAGFRQILAERHRSVVVAMVRETGENGDEAGHIVLAAFADDPSIRAVYHMSAGARPVVEALRRLGRAEDTVVLTHELTDDRRVLLRERAIAAVIDQQPELEARLAVGAMARLLGRLEDAGAPTPTDVRIYMPETA